MTIRRIKNTKSYNRNWINSLNSFHTQKIPGQDEQSSTKHSKDKFVKFYPNSSKEEKEEYSPTDFMKLGQSWFQNLTRRVHEGKNWRPTSLTNIDAK